MTDIKEGDLFSVKDTHTSGLRMFRDVSSHDRQMATPGHDVHLFKHDFLIFLGKVRHLDTAFLTKHGIAGWNMGNMGRKEDMLKYFYKHETG